MEKPDVWERLLEWGCSGKWEESIFTSLLPIVPIIVWMLLVIPFVLLVPIVALMKGVLFVFDKIGESLGWYCIGHRHLKLDPTKWLTPPDFESDEWLAAKSSYRLITAAFHKAFVPGLYAGAIILFLALLLVLYLLNTEPDGYDGRDWALQPYYFLILEVLFLISLSWVIICFYKLHKITVRKKKQQEADELMYIILNARVVDWPLVAHVKFRDLDTNTRAKVLRHRRDIGMTDHI